jgi:integrase
MSEHRKRRRPGEGSVRTYQTSQGARWSICYRVADPATGERRQVFRRGFTTERKATAELRRVLAKADAGEYVEPSKQTLAAYLDTWLAGMRIATSTRASYAKNIRLHIRPRLGGTPLAKLTSVGLNELYRELEASGRTDGVGGLSARTVRYVATILHRALGNAVKAGMLLANPADRATPPSAKDARPPEMTVWTGRQLRAFLDYVTEKGNDLAPAFTFMASTGVRRGECLALRWRDLDLDAARASIRRSAGLLKAKGDGQSITEGPTKTGKPRVVELDHGTVMILKRHRAELASIGLRLAKDDALVFGTATGEFRHPERFSRRFTESVAAARRDLGEDLPAIRLHDLRHTHASLLLAAGVPVKEVSDRLGHASPVITLGVYAHVIPSMTQSAARWTELMSDQVVDKL